MLQARDAHGRPAFPDRFKEAARFGAYLRIVEEGEVGAGDAIDIVREGSGGVTVRELGLAYYDADVALARRVLADDDTPDTWRAWAQRAIGRDG